MKNMRTIVSLSLVALIVVFSMQNAEELQVRFLFWSVTMRRVFVLFGVLAVGIIVGWLLRTRAQGDAKGKTDSGKHNSS